MFITCCYWNLDLIDVRLDAICMCSIISHVGLYVFFLRRIPWQCKIEDPDNELKSERKPIIIVLDGR